MATMMTMTPRLQTGAYHLVPIILLVALVVITFLLNVSSSPPAGAIIWSPKTDTAKKEARTSLQELRPIVQVAAASSSSIRQPNDDPPPIIPTPTVITATTRSILIPEHPDKNCRDKVLSAIDGVVPYNKSRFVHCPVTSQVRIFLNADSTLWIMESLDGNGDKKTVGGDEYYITYQKHNDSSSGHERTKSSGEQHVTAVARALDQNDGTYKLQWTASPMLSSSPSANLLTTVGTTGTLAVHFEYTCGIGRMGQPMKDEWNHGGATHTAYSVVLENVPDYFQSFQPPRTDIDLGQFDQVFVLGDSVMGNFVGRGQGCFGKTNIVPGSSPASALNSKTVDAWMQHVRSNYSEAILTSKNATTAVLIGSSTWDILRNSVDQWMTWEDHATAARRLITSIRGEFPNVTVLWKSATAIHICNPDIEAMAIQSKYWGVERTRYMSESRSRDIDVVQRKLMLELNVPLLDVYDATYLAADWARHAQDARHYNTQMNRVMLNWFYQQS